MRDITPETKYWVIFKVTYTYSNKPEETKIKVAEFPTAIHMQQWMDGSEEPQANGDFIIKHLDCSHSFEELEREIEHRTTRGGQQ